VKSGGAVEKLLFPVKQPKLGDAKCLGIRKDRLQLILMQFCFREFCEKEFFNSVGPGR
jgi:hypothetical protein